MRILLVPAASLLVMATGLTVNAVASAAPLPVHPVAMNSRTSFAFVSLVPGTDSGTANSNQPRPALSIIKLYLVDYVLRHGDGSASDRALSQRAIQLSDNDAASALDNKYPNAIDATAAEYQLPNTSRGSFWGTSLTSAADIANFLLDKERSDPASPILGWMATASPVAADGTAENWGTAHLPGVIGTKWGWSDDRTSLVASASIGPGFAVAAMTNGSPADENADVRGILP
ncbi:hypothetical protein FOS14_07895 [Skermania sp. ID1734]|uniref:hypothetical protein n=1 Tax=Skermania sp. ID1734 TaxID=2597516 RepID=UPI00117FFCCC|nr:hypothetical protein [Skermania sp. ID1734]TSE00341.1 hypothetical protein FOS14_07895 [Skermania sp. ID1734]